MPSSFDQYKTAFFGASSRGSTHNLVRSAGFGKVGFEGAGKNSRRNSQCILTLRHRGRLYTNGVSERIARTITVPPERGERARWKWLLPRLRKLRVSRCSSEHRPRRRLREGLFRACREDVLL